MEVSPGMVSQWKTGRRPVPPESARRLAALLGVADPRAISARFSSILQNEAPAPVGDQALAALYQRVEALESLVGAFVSAMLTHRPAEAADVARSIQRRVPVHQQQGLLQELLSALEMVPRLRIADDAPAAGKRRSVRPRSP